MTAYWADGKARCPDTLYLLDARRDVKKKWGFKLISTVMTRQYDSVGYNS